MKIRKAIINDASIEVYIYENKKQEYMIAAIPDYEWSYKINYDEESNDLKEKMAASLLRVVNDEVSAELTAKLYYWTHEM